MKFKPEKKYLQIGLTLFFVAVGTMLVYFLFFRLSEIRAGIQAINKILAPIFYGLVLAYLMTPLMNTIEQKWLYPLFNKYNWWSKDKKRNKHIRGLSVLFTFAVVILLFYLFFASVIPQLYSSIQNLVSQYSTYTGNLTNYINSSLDNNPDVAKFLSSLVKDYSSEADDYLNDMVLPAIQSLLMPNMNDILSSLSNGIMKVIMFLWNVIIGLVISLYVLSSKEKFLRGFTRLTYAIFERTSANKFLDSVRFTHQTFIGFLAGKIVDSFIIGVICYICCLFAKMPYAILVSVIVGVTNIIPFFGPYIGAVPSTIIILLVDPKKALTFIIMILIIQQVDGNFIGPAILSQSTGLTSFWIIFAITLFGGLMGVPGMIIGVPVTAVIGAGIEKWTQGRLARKELPTDAENYYNVGFIDEDHNINPYVMEKPEKKKVNKNSPFYKLGVAIGRFFCKIGQLIWGLIKLAYVKIKGLIHKKNK